MRYLLVVFLLSGCAIPSEWVARGSDLDVCLSYGIYRDSPFWVPAAERYWAELTKRQLLTEHETTLVKNKKINMGMSLCALYASWGRPDRENRTTTRYGENIQHVYNLGYNYIRPSYVYTTDGKVSGWQN